MTKQLETIAVGFDGSLPAEAAVRWAFALAGPMGARVVLVHAAGLRARLDPEDVNAEFRESIDQLCEECAFDPARVTFEVDEGDSCSVLVRAAGEPINADLVVVGSRGKSVHAGLLLGSTSLQLAERSTIPVVIVPTGR